VGRHKRGAGNKEGNNKEVDRFVSKRGKNHVKEWVTRCSRGRGLREAGEPKEKEGVGQKHEGEVASGMRKEKKAGSMQRGRSLSWSGPLRTPPSRRGKEGRAKEFEHWEVFPGNTKGGRGLAGCRKSRLVGKKSVLIKERRYDEG